MMTDTPPDAAQAWGALKVDTTGAVSYTDLTPLLAEVVPAGMTDGLLHVFVGHTTCTMIMNSGVDGTTLTDIRLFIERSVPVDSPFVHLSDGPQDAAAHARLVFGSNSLQVPVIGGQIGLGSSQGIYLLELDGPRSRTVQYAVARFG